MTDLHQIDVVSGRCHSIRSLWIVWVEKGAACMVLTYIREAAAVKRACNMASACLVCLLCLAADYR